MAGLAATALIILCVVMGAAGASWWLVPVLAVAGSFVYGWLKGAMFAAIIERSGLGFLLMIYVTQCLTIGFFFLIGRGVGSIF